MTSQPFGDHFSTQASAYARFRPSYPEQLYDHIVGYCAQRELALDCGTGSGQVACTLGERFERVVATEPSRNQLAHARLHPRVEYRQTRAECSGLPDGSVDLVTAGAAVHWFDLEPYLAEVARVLKTGGVVAFWTYSPYLDTSIPGLTSWLQQLSLVRLAEDWPPGMHWVRERYLTLPFPFRELETPEFYLELDWSFEQLLGWVGTWSAVVRHQERLGRPVLAELSDGLQSVWPAAETVVLKMPLHLRLGKAKPSP